MSNHLMGFRLGYLRAIARAWEEPPFLDKLTSPHADVFDILRAEFNFDSPWHYLKFHLRKNDSHWEPTLANSWVGDGPSDLFHIKLPDPCLVEAAEQTQAIADYYQHFPTLFGPTYDLKKVHPNSGDLGSQDNLGGHDDNFINFGGMVLKALALAWKEPDTYGKMLTCEESGILALQQLKFNNPWNFNIKFSFSTDFHWDADEKRWTHAPHNLLTLNLPNSPDDCTLRPIALTRYNYTGAQYPFTCDCR